MNLKSFLILLMLNIFSVIVVNASNSVRQNVVLTEIELSVVNDDPEPEIGNGREHLSLGIGFGELVLPKLSIENYIFYFNSDCNGCDVEFLQDGVVVFEDVFDATGTYDIPEFLTGTLEVRLIIGNTIYVGTIEL